MLYDLYKKFTIENYKLYIILIIGTLLSIILQKIALGHYYGKILNTLRSNKSNSVGNNSGLIKKLFIIVLSIYTLIQCFNLVTSYCNKILWPKLESYVRQHLMNIILERYNESYEEMKNGEIQTMMHDFPWIIDTIYNKVQKFLLINTIMIGSTIIYLGKYHKLLALSYIISVILVLGLSLFYVRNCNSIIVDENSIYMNLFSQIDDILNNILSIFTNNKIKDEKKVSNKINDETVKTQISTSTYFMKFQILFSIVNIIIYIIMNYISYTLYRDGSINTETYIAVFIINFNMLGDLITLYHDAKDYAVIKARMNIINDYFKNLPKKVIKKKDVGLNKTISDKGGVEIIIKDLYFKHKDEDKYVYNGLNLTIPVNQDLLIMGSIGSGKSTIAKLLIKLHKFNKGNILMNGININDINSDELRNNIIYVPQNPQLFNRTLWENITYGLTDNEMKKLTPEKIYKLLNDNQMNDVSNRFKDMMSENVGKNGSKLSGGQRQIVWLLRALFKDNNVLILDEPTSALDNNSKKYIINLIKIIKKTKSVIIITHDDEFKKIMDRLIFFHKGKIIKDTMLY